MNKKYVEREKRTFGYLEVKENDVWTSKWESDYTAQTYNANKDKSR